MFAFTRGTGTIVWVAVRALLLFTLVLGVGYTLTMTGLARNLFPAQADGSLIRDEAGTVVGSSLIGQSFTDADGDPLPGYFQSRPSATGDGYDGGASSGSNLGPENPDLLAAITARQDGIADLEQRQPQEVPADAVTASASGLDPHISVDFALLQVARVAEDRGLSVEEVRDLLRTHTQSRDLGFLGEPRVNVLDINLELTRMEEAG